MINLTTCCGKSDTLLAALMIIFFALPLGLFGQLDESIPSSHEGDPEVSVLEMSHSSKPGATDSLQHQDTKAQTASNPDETGKTEQHEHPILLPNSTDSVDFEDPQVLLRGPLHEAFADSHQADPQPNPIVNAIPPEAITEIPPDFKPEGDNVEWIAGYWAWDDSKKNFIWISGVWRDVPPTQRWVPGYWEQVDDGHRWIAGFWADLESQELNYLPTPPSSIDRGPSVAAPSDDYLYCPGNWIYQGDVYVWRPGHWQPRVANWIWIPARYIWTPRGCVFRPGFWDREFDVRGTLFAPVYFQHSQYLANNFCFQPNHCVNTGAEFFVHLFLRPDCNHYYYGNWYGQEFITRGYRPWVYLRSNARSYDPLFAYYNCTRYRQGSQLFVSWVHAQHRHYHRNRNLRPRNTLQAQLKFTRSAVDQSQYEFIRRANLTKRFDNIVHARVNQSTVRHPGNRHQLNAHAAVNKKYVRTDRRDNDLRRANELIQREIKNARKAGEQRARNASRDGKRVVKEATNKRHVNKKHARNSVHQKSKQATNRNIAQSNKIVLPKTPAVKSTNRIDPRTTKELSRSTVKQTGRDQDKVLRKRELDRKIAAAKQQTEIKQKQKAAARELNLRQRQQRIAQAQQKTAREKQAKLVHQNRTSPQTKHRVEKSTINSANSQNANKSQELQRRKPSVQLRRQPNSTRNPNANQRIAQNAQQQTAADLIKKQNSLNRVTNEQAKRNAARKAAQARESAQQRDIRRQREKMANAQAAAQKRKETQARAATEKSRRDAARHAAQQRAQQKAQADAQRREREKSKRDAQRKADQARRAADAARKRQRQQEQAAQRAKRKKTKR